MELRDYQVLNVSDIREAFAEFRRTLFVSPTGSGKTAMFSYISAGVAKNYKRVWIMVHRRELLKQVSDALREWRVKHALLSAGVLGVPRANVIVASVFTLKNRLKYMLPPDLIIGDEAHHFAPGSTWHKCIEAFPSARVLGVTASPIRLDGVGLGDCFDTLVEGCSVAELTARGYLSPAEVYAPATIDVAGVHRRGGDFKTEELAEAADKPTITGSAVEHYRRLADGKRAVAFCCSIKHAKHVAAEFRAAGIPSEHVDGKMEDHIRDRVIQQFRDGVIKVLTSCDLISEGFDVATIECAILLRPTESLGLYLQQVGRAVRIAPGKIKTIVLDHAGNTKRHGFIDEPRKWSLAGVEKAVRAESVPRVTTCERCFACYAPSAGICPRCGNIPEIKDRKVKHVDGELVQIGGSEAYTPADDTAELERQFWILRQVGINRGYEDPIGWSFKITSAKLATKLAKERSATGDTTNGLLEVELDSLRSKTIERAMSKEGEISA